MNYLRAELLKYKHSFEQKIVYIVPICTIFFMLLMGQYFQSQTIYWWYLFILPEIIVVYCSLSEKREKSIRYQIFNTLYINLEKVWYARVLIIIGYLLVISIILAIFAMSPKIWAPNYCAITEGKILLGCICAVIMSAWQVPILLFMSKRFGMFFIVIINCILPIVSVFLANTKIWFLMPYCLVSRAVKNIIGIDVNGIMISDYKTNICEFCGEILLSVFIFIVATYVTAKKFKMVGK